MTQVNARDDTSLKLALLERETVREVRAKIAYVSALTRPIVDNPLSWDFIIGRIQR